MIETTLEEAIDPILRVGSGTQKGVNTDVVTAEGTVAAIEFLDKEFPELPTWQLELQVNIAASDWTNGHEERVMKALTRDFGLMCATRVIAYVAGTPGRAR